jgi:hypothetical protein
VLVGLLQLQQLEEAEPGASHVQGREHRQHPHDH